MPIKRTCIYLEKKNALVRINLAKGTVGAYCLSPELVWTVALMTKNSLRPSILKPWQEQQTTST